MTYRAAKTRERVGGAAGASLLVALIGYVLVAGFGGDLPRRIAEDMKVVALLPDPPPPRPDPVTARRETQRRKRGAASPPNLTARTTEIVAPPLVVRPPPAPPVIVSRIAGPGSDPSVGAAPVAGPGSGSGGRGNGPGSGDGGEGDGGGGGGGGGSGIEAELVSNKLYYRDLPRDLWDARASGMVTYRAVIGTNGRLSDCRIVRSSGDPALDAATCTLALRHVRFRPARDAAGRRVADHAVFEQEWTVERRLQDERSTSDR